MLQIERDDLDGAPLKKIQRRLSNKTRDKEPSTIARKFVIRLVPSLAHLMGVPLQILQGHVNMHSEEKIEPSMAMAFANRCARRGYSNAEMAPFGSLMWSATWSRREVHRHFADIIPYLKPAPVNESKEALEARVESATDSELNNRGLDDLT